MPDLVIVPQLGNVGIEPCYQTEQDRYLDFMAKTTWVLPLGVQAGVYVGDTPPTDTTLVWIKLDASTGGPTHPAPFVYEPNTGLWLARYRVPPQPDHKEIMMWKGSEAELWSYDGGDGADPGAAGTNPTIATGSFWYWDRDYDDRVPGGYDDTPGTLNAQDTDFDLFPAASSGAGIQVRSAIFARRTTRVFWTP